MARVQNVRCGREEWNGSPGMPPKREPVTQLKIIAAQPRNAGTEELSNIRKEAQDVGEMVSRKARNTTEENSVFAPAAAQRAAGTREFKYYETNRDVEQG